MADHDPSDSGSGAQVLNFRRRTGAAAPPPQPREVVEDLSKYDDDDIPDDYKHRMAVNIAAFVILVSLVGIGYWLADTMASQRKNQDCVLSGRRNCAGVAVPSLQR